MTAVPEPQHRRLVIMPPGYRAITSPLIPDDRVLVVDVDEVLGRGRILSRFWADTLDTAVLNVAARSLPERRNT